MSTCALATGDGMSRRRRRDRRRAARASRGPFPWWLAAALVAVAALVGLARVLR